MNDLGLTRARAVAACRLWPQTRRFKACIWRAEVEGRRFLVKDYRHTHWLYRFTLARLEQRRELRAYRRLAGLPFVVRCHGRLDPDALVFEAVDARTLTAVPSEDLQPVLFQQLRAAVAAMHDRGILHNDLRHRTNILVTARGELRLVDFAGSLDVGQGGLRRWLFGWLGFLDRSAAIKWWLRYFPDQVPAGERKWYRGYLRVRQLWPVRNPALARQGQLVRRRESEKAATD
jgi:hypothetical protein